jgi:hypothetical protein
MVRYNMLAGTAAFYLIAVLWIAFTIPSAAGPGSPIYYMIAASVTLAGIVLPIKIYSRYKKQKKDREQ